eukprot:scpid49167/ scgid21282/ 
MESIRDQCTVLYSELSTVSLDLLQQVARSGNNLPDACVSHLHEVYAKCSAMHKLLSCKSCRSLTLELVFSGPDLMCQQCALVKQRYSSPASVGAQHLDGLDVAASSCVGIIRQLGLSYCRLCEFVDCQAGGLPDSRLVDVLESSPKLQAAFPGFSALLRQSIKLVADQSGESRVICTAGYSSSSNSNSVTGPFAAAGRFPTIRKAACQTPSEEEEDMLMNAMPVPRVPSDGCDEGFVSALTDTSKAATTQNDSSKAPSVENSPESGNASTAGSSSQKKLAKVKCACDYSSRGKQLVAAGSKKRACKRKAVTIRCPLTASQYYHISKWVETVEQSRPYTADEAARTWHLPVNQREPSMCWNATASNVNFAAVHTPACLQQQKQRIQRKYAQYGSYAANANWRQVAVISAFNFSLQQQQHKQQQQQRLQQQRQQRGCYTFDVPSTLSPVPCSAEDPAYLRLVTAASSRPSPITAELSPPAAAVSPCMVTLAGHLPVSRVAKVYSAAGNVQLDNAALARKAHALGLLGCRLPSSLPLSLRADSMLLDRSVMRHCSGHHHHHHHTRHPQLLYVPKVNSVYADNAMLFNFTMPSAGV